MNIISDISKCDHAIICIFWLGISS